MCFLLDLTIVTQHSHQVYDVSQEPEEKDYEGAAKDPKGQEADDVSPARLEDVVNYLFKVGDGHYDELVEDKEEDEGDVFNPIHNLGEVVPQFFHNRSVFDP